jgi:hypothetical protein
MRCFGRLPDSLWIPNPPLSRLLVALLAATWLFGMKGPVEAASAPRIWLEDEGAALDCMSSRSLSLRMEGGQALSLLRLEIRFDPRLVEVDALDLDSSRISMLRDSGEALDLRALATAESEGRPVSYRPDWIRLELRPRRSGGQAAVWPGRLFVLQLRGLAAGDIPFELRVIEARDAAGKALKPQVDAMRPLRVTCPGMTPVASLFDEDNSWSSAMATPAAPASLPLTGEGGLSPGCVLYRWRAGDDFRSLARAFRDDTMAMARRNAVLNPMLLREGDSLRLCRLGGALQGP